MSRPESLTRPERRILTGARFTLTFLIKRKHFFSGNPMTIYKFKRPITFTLNNMHLQNNAFYPHNSCHSFSHAFILHFIYHITTCIFNAIIQFTIQFMKFKYTHKNPIYTRQCWLFQFDYLIHISDGFRLMNPTLIIIR